MSPKVLTYDERGEIYNFNFDLILSPKNGVAPNGDETQAAKCLEDGADEGLKGKKNLVTQIYDEQTKFNSVKVRMGHVDCSGV